MTNLINQIKLIIVKYGEIEKINGTNFNIFSILNMERNEVKTHSNFIYELLNKNGSHGQGSIFLDLFLNEILDNQDYGNIEYTQAIQEDLTQEKRRIDFTIETSKYQVGVEMKIDARDHKHQMYDYYQELKNRLKKNQELRLFYLTLDGKEPSDESINILTENNYVLISFDIHIVQWIEKCIKESATNTIIREALVQYLNLIKKLTNKSNSQGKIMEIKNILKNGENLKAYLQAEESVVEAKKELQLRFWNKLKEKLDNTNYGFKFESNNNAEKNIDSAVERYYTKSKNNKDYGFTYYFDDEEDFYISAWTGAGKIYYSIGSLEENKKFDDIKNNINYIDYCENDKYYGDKYFKEELNFNDLLSTPKVFDLFYDNKLDEITESIKNELLEITIEIEELLNK